MNYPPARPTQPTTGSQLACLAREAPQKVRLRNSDKPLKIRDVLNANQFARGSLGKRRKGRQRPKMPTLAVSVVRSPLPKPFETKRISDAQLRGWGVCNEKLAEGEKPPSNVLWEEWLISAVQI